MNGMGPIRSGVASLCVTASLLLLSGCGTGGRGGSIPYDIALGRPDAPQPATAVDDKLAPLDTINIYVYQVPDLTRDYTIDLAGNLIFPLIGPVKAVGLSTIELQTLLQQKLGQRYLRDPNITVTLKDSQRRVVTVEGAVTSPGVFPTVGPITLLQAVALAKGPTDVANPHRVAVFRQIDGKHMAAAFDLISIGHDESKDPTIYPGDIVVIDGSSLRKGQHDFLQSIPLLALFTPIL